MNVTRYSSVLFLLAITACGGPAVADGPPSSPDGTIRYVANGIADGRAQVIWQALPESYKHDINELTHLFASKMDREVWDKSASVLKKAAVVLREKKDLFLGSDLLSMAGDDRDEIAANWDTGAVVLDSLVNSELGSLESLSAIDWGHFLETTGNRLIELAKEASAKTEDDNFENDFVAKVREMKIEILDQSEDLARVSIGVPDGEPETLALTRIEGRWVPSEMADDWAKNVEESRAKLNAITPETIAQQKMQIMMFVGMAEAFVDQIAQAKTSEELDQMLRGMFGGMMGGSNGTPPTADEG